MFRVTIGTIAVLFGASGVQAETITFNQMPLDTIPAGFSMALTGEGSSPRWLVKAAPGSTNNRVVMQTSAEALDNRFPMLILDSVNERDMDVSVRFRPISGKVDQAAGLVWRYLDANNYYLVRANALENNVVTYKVENGRRIDLPVEGQGRTYGAKAPVSKTDWNTLAVSINGDLFTISFNGETLYNVRDTTFPKSGRIGMWTKADSVMMFDVFSWNYAR